MIKSKRLNKMVGIMVALAMILSVFASSGVAKATEAELDKENLADGTYKINVDLWHATSDQASMAAGVIEKEAELEVVDGVATVHLHFKEMEMFGIKAMMINLTVYKGETATGETVTTTKVKEVDYTYTGERGETTVKCPTEIAVELPHRGEYLPVNMESTFMSSDARVKIDWSTLELVELAEPEPVDPTPGNVLELEDGEYKVPVDLWNATSDKASMAASAILKNAKVVVDGKSAKMIIYTKEMTVGTIKASLQTLKVKDAEGNFNAATILTEDSNGNPTSFEFEIPNKTEYIDVLVNPEVAMMGNSDIPARLKVDFASIEKVASGTEVNPGEENTNNTTSNTTNEDNGQDADQVKETDVKNSSTPKTGDDSPIGVMTMLLMASLGAGAYAYRKNI